MGRLCATFFVLALAVSARGGEAIEDVERRLNELWAKVDSLSFEMENLTVNEQDPDHSSQLSKGITEQLRVGKKWLNRCEMTQVWKGKNGSKDVQFKMLNI